MEDLKIAYNHTDIEPFYVGNTSAAISVSGDILATPNEEDIVISNLETNEILHRIEGDGELITTLVISPDGNKLAVVSQSQQLRIIDVAQGTPIKSFKLPSPAYVSCADSTSSLFAFGGTDGTVTVWDIEGGYVTHSLKGHNTTVCSLRFHGELNSPNWKLASGDIMGTVRVWDLVKRKAIVNNNEHNSAVRGLGFDSNSEYFVTGGRDDIVVIYRMENLKKPWKTYPVRHQVENCGFVDVEDRMVLYTAGADNYLKLWDFHTGKLVGTSTKPLETNEELLIIDVVPLEGNRLMLVISDQTLVELDLTEIDHEDGAIEIPIQRRVAGNHGTVADIRYVGPDFSLVAMATNAPALRIMDPEKPFELRLYEGHTDLLNALDVSYDGKWIATASKDNEARLWKWDDDAEDFAEYAVFKGHAGAVTAIALPRSDEPRFVITASSDLTIKKWKVPKTAGTTVKTSDYTRRAHDKDINAIDISPNDQYLATASYDKFGKIWDIESGETISILKGHRRGLWDINFCKYDQLVITSSGDKTVKMWSLKNYSCTQTFEGHTNAVQRCRFLNKNQQVISSGADGLIKVWTVKNEGECVKTFDVHGNRIWAFDIKNDGMEFVSADADGQISLWEDNSEEMRLQMEEQNKLKIEQEQNLSNYINKQDWSNAFLLALTLEHSMRLHNVVKSSIEANQDQESVIGSFELENTIKSLDEEQMLKLFKKIRDWNINFKFFEISQKLLRVLINDITITPALNKIIESIIPYNERHYSRLDGLIEESYILDYAVEEMSK